MNIIFDTNIFHKDLLLKSGRFDILLDYAKKTNSLIVLPKIVLEEALAAYEQEVVGKVSAYSALRDELSALTQIEIPELQVDISSKVQQYAKRFQDRLGINGERVVDYKSEYLQEVVRRAIHRIKPCSEKGEEFRDTILWLTVLDVALSAPDKATIFISNNKREFGSTSQQLHPTLIDDAKQKGVTIEYYTTLDEFIQKRAAKIEHINHEWLAQKISLELIDSKVVELLNGVGRTSLDRWIEQRDALFTGYSNPQASFMQIERFYVYEMTDGALRITATYSGEVEIEYETENVITTAPNRYRSQIDEEVDHYVEYMVSSGEWGSNRTQVAYKYIYPELSVTIEAVIQDDKLGDFEIVEWDYL